MDDRAHSLVDRAARPRRLRRPDIGGRRGRCRRRARSRCPIMTFVACPGFVGEFGLPAHRDVFIGRVRPPPGRRRRSGLSPSGPASRRRGRRDCAKLGTVFDGTLTGSRPKQDASLLGPSGQTGDKVTVRLEPIPAAQSYPAMILLDPGLSKAIQICLHLIGAFDVEETFLCKGNRELRLCHHQIS